MITLSLVNGPRAAWCKVEGEGFSLRMLNERSLEYFLKKQLNICAAVREVIMVQLYDEGSITIDLQTESIAS